MSNAAEQPVFDPKNMPFRRLGSSGLRVPLFSLGGCALLPSSSSRSFLHRGEGS